MAMTAVSNRLVTQRMVVPPSGGPPSPPTVVDTRGHPPHILPTVHPPRGPKKDPPLIKGYRGTKASKDVVHHAGSQIPGRIKAGLSEGRQNGNQNAHRGTNQTGNQQGDILVGVVVVVGFVVFVVGGTVAIVGESSISVSMLRRTYMCFGVGVLLLLLLLLLWRRDRVQWLGGAVVVVMGSAIEPYRVIAVVVGGGFYSWL